jgi:hypothetical protein
LALTESTQQRGILFKETPPYNALENLRVSRNSSGAPEWCLASASTGAGGGPAILGDLVADFRNKEPQT